eukprot:5275624-Pleurochrysis_carterae.AAC.1
MEVRIDASFGFGEKRGFDVFWQIFGGRRMRGLEGGRNARWKAHATIGGGYVDVEQVRNRPFILDVPMVPEVAGELLVQRAIAVVSVESEEVINVTAKDD